MKIEEEAKQFRARKQTSVPPKPLSSRTYLIGMAMNALLIKANNSVRLDDIKREAENIADYMLED